MCDFMGHQPTGVRLHDSASRLVVRVGGTPKKVGRRAAVQGADDVHDELVGPHTVSVSEERIVLRRWVSAGAGADIEVDYARYSPDAHATGWKTPVLIIHGERDYRVPIGEAIAMYDRLEAQGVDCELAVFPDEGHWIQRPRNIRAWYQLWQRFVAERLTAP